MMVGYWNRPDASAESIVDGWLRTGDAGRMDEEGYLYIEDRVKDMVVTGAELIAYARARLAHYKCPTGITFVDALSRNCSSATSGRSSPDHLCGQALLNSAEETTRRHPADRRRT